MEIDRKLLQACKKGDRIAQSALYKRCFNLLMGVAIRYVRNEEEAVSLVNQGFLKIITNLDSWKETAPWGAWIRRIMINTVIDEFRKTKKHRELIQYTDFQEPENHWHFFELNEAETKLDAEALTQMIRNLPEVTGKVFNLFAIDGFSHKEISKSLGISEGTSKWHVSDARKKLKGMIQQQLKSQKPLLL